MIRGYIRKDILRERVMKECSVPLYLVMQMNESPHVEEEEEVPILTEGVVFDDRLYSQREDVEDEEEEEEEAAKERERESGRVFSRLLVRTQGFSQYLLKLFPHGEM